MSIKFEPVGRGFIVVLTILSFLWTVGFGREVADQKRPQDLSGTWALQSHEAKVTLVIDQVGPEIRMTRKTNTGGQAESTYYSDGRGEVNPASGNKALRSVTEWKGEKLIVKFSLPQTRSGNYPVVNERVDEWGISNDGKTLTQISTFTSVSSHIDATTNPSGRPRIPDMLATPIRRVEKKVFKRVA